MLIDVIDCVDYMVWQGVAAGRTVGFFHHGENQQIHQQFTVHKFGHAIVPQGYTGREQGTYFFGNTASGREWKGSNLVGIKLIIIIRRIAAVEQNDIG